MEARDRSKRAVSFLLSAAVVVADQLSKAWIVAHVPQGTVYKSYLGDFLSIWHVRNQAVGFSLGAALPSFAKIILFIILPLCLLALMVIFILRTDELSSVQRWLVAALIGGGLGNLIDRIFREDWVVDFISVRVYGLFGLDRWPTFNLADSTVVVAGIALMITILFDRKNRSKRNRGEIMNQGESDHE